MRTQTEPDPTATRALNKRAFLAGGAATSALIAAAALVFISLAAYVAFNGIPGGGGNDGAGSVVIGSTPGAVGAPEAAGTVLAGAPGAVAASAAATPIALAPAGGGGATLAPGGPGGTDAPSSPIVGGLREEDPESPVLTPDVPRGVVGGTIDEIEENADSVVNTPLGDLTEALTKPLDETLDQALEDIGGALGNPDLGNELKDGVVGLREGAVDGVNQGVGDLLRSG
jgi:hypothetical protein